jgi:peptidoglycan/LPS O-acetylase OafA/YrhL
LTISGFVFASTVLGGTLADGWARVRGMPLWNGFYGDTTIHLWFLYDLMWMYLAAVVIAAATRFVPDRWRRGVVSLFALLMQNRWRVVWLAIPTFVMFWFMPLGILRTSTSFIPDPVVLLAYGLFFGFGWMVYLARETLSSFGRHARRQVLLALLIGPINTTAAIRGIESPVPDMVATTVAAGTAALIVWLLTFGLTGLFQRYLGRPNPVVRYFVDASYWVYLLHLPFMIWIPALLAGATWPSTAKALVVLGVTTVICVFTYDLFVRGTFIGMVLNGRRYPRGLPVLDHNGAPMQPAAVPDATA